MAYPCKKEPCATTKCGGAHVAKWGLRAVEGDRCIPVAIVEDEGLFRDLLRRALDQDASLRVVGEFDSAKAALERIPALRPDVVILDIELGGGMNGVQLGLALRKCLPRLGIVLLSNHANPQFLAAVPRTEAGGWSYLLKRSVRDLDALKRVILGSSMGYVVLDQQIVDTLQHREASVLSRLTPRQYEILSLIAQGYTNAAIADQLGLSEKSVQNHINSLYQQLGLDREDASVQPRVTAVLTYLQETSHGFGRTL